MASLLTLDYLKAEAASGDRSAFDRFMGLVPDAPAAPGDVAVVVGSAGKRQELTP